MAIQSHLLALEPLPLDSIDFEDPTFALRFARDVEPALCDSLRRIGMLHPPLLQEWRGAWRIVCGFGRLGAWKALGHEEVWARLAPATASFEALLLLGIEENQATRGLNAIEQALALDKLRATMEPQRLADDVLPLLGHRPSLATVERLTGYLSLPATASEALARGVLPQGAAERILEFPADERESAARCILALRLSAGACRDFARQGTEVCRRDSIGLDALLERLRFGVEIEIDPAEVPRERERFLRALRHARYPILTRLEADYAARHKEMGLPSIAQIHPPRDFEGCEYRLEARLESEADLRELAQALGKSVEESGDAIRALFQMRFEE